MTDIVSQAKRSEMMAGIKGKNTKPELIIRLALHALGFRYRLHVKNLPGKPDIVLPRHKAVLFIHGCFWHGHDCPLFKMPSTKTEFWEQKINRNRLLDSLAEEKLVENGWRVGVVWECCIRGKKRRNFIETIDAIRDWLLSDKKMFEIRSHI